MKRSVLKALAICCCAVLFVTVVMLPTSAEPEPAQGVDGGSAQAVAANAGLTDYDEYAAAHAGETRPQKEIRYGIDAITGDKTVKIHEGVSCAVLSSATGSVTYEVVVEEAGLYRLQSTYLPVVGKMKNIVFSLQIDGNLPFHEAEAISLSRIFEDDGDVKRDQSGNDIRPSQKEVIRFHTREFGNTDGYYHDPYAFSFSAGRHTVTLAYAEETMWLAEIALTPVKTLPTYAQYSAGAKEAAASLTVYEAEKTFEKSSSMLYPTYDRSTPATSPSHYSKIRYNTIGQANWSQQGQWISWKISAQEDGWYAITLKARQNIRQGVTSCRTLTIDGEVPFEEVNGIEFPYAMKWQMKTLSDENGTPYLFHLTKGEHVLALEVAAGKMGKVLKNLSDSVRELNNLYRSIIMVTGATPDQYRTYYLEESIPDLFEKLEAERDTLSDLYADIRKITGTGGSEASVIKEMEIMLTDFLKKPLNIPTRVTAFKDSIESMGSVILSLSDQPLELDYLVVSSQTALPKGKASFPEFLSYSVKGFIASFVEDYNAISSSADGGDTDTAITVWISNGRDQAQILKNRIDNDFTPATGTDVKLSIVSTAAGTASSTLVQATLAGKGPDVALFTPKDTPINLAMRGALTDLSELPGYEEVYRRFYEYAWIPYAYQDGMYAVPETQNYEMMFYRSDIFEEFGLEPPQTWEEFYTVIEILQKSNLQVGVLETNAVNAGISSGIAFFEKQLLQNGGSYYNTALNKTAFDESVAYDAFRAWTD
ncbi:MAG: extracellular solute-binding protein, partial [Clostridia bacterium]|nr:extracellular solute-binding protein [Clostridia bacterium]